MCERCSRTKIGSTVLGGEEAVFVFACVLMCVFLYVVVCVFVCVCIHVFVVCERCSRAEIGSILLGGEEAGRDPGLTVAKSNGAATNPT